MNCPLCNKSLFEYGSYNKYACPSHFNEERNCFPNKFCYILDDHSSRFKLEFAILDNVFVKNTYNKINLEKSTELYYKNHLYSYTDKMIDLPFIDISIGKMALNNRINKILALI